MKEPLIPGHLGTVRLLPEAYEEYKIPDGDVRQVIVHSFADGDGPTAMHDYLAREDIRVEYSYGVYTDGRIEQWVPVGYAADATIHAKNHSVSIVFESDSTSSSKPFTEAQWEALIKITAWLVEEWGIELQLIPKGEPTSGHGLGWHRMYIEGNADALSYASPLDFQGSRSYSWSTSRGKTCPGDERVRRLESDWVRDVEKALGRTKEDEVTDTSRYASAEERLRQLEESMKPVEFFVDRQREINPKRAKAVTTLQARTSTLEQELAELTAEVDQVVDRLNRVAADAVEAEIAEANRLDDEADRHSVPDFDRVADSALVALSKIYNETLGEDPDDLRIARISELALAAISDLR